jgi:hypothetical protein
LIKIKVDKDSIVLFEKYVEINELTITNISNSKSIQYKIFCKNKIEKNKVMNTLSKFEFVSACFIEIFEELSKISDDHDFF